MVNEDKIPPHDDIDKFAEEKRRIREAQERRHEEVAEHFRSGSLDKSILSVEKSEVVYTLDPKYLPFSQSNFFLFVSEVNKRFGTTFNDPTQPFRGGPNTAELPEDERSAIIGRLPSLFEPEPLLLSFLSMAAFA